MGAFCSFRRGAACRVVMVLRILYFVFFFCLQRLIGIFWARNTSTRGNYTTIDGQSFDVHTVSFVSCRSVDDSNDSKIDWTMHARVFPYTTKKL